MKAAVCYEFGKPLVVEEVEIDPPKSGEVKVRIVATAICHTDIHLIKGDWGGPTPVIAGHEAAGVVEEIGKNVTKTKLGDRVVVSLLRSCGRCLYCTIGSPHLCEGQFALGAESRLHTGKGQSIFHGTKTAAFAEYVIVDQSQLVPILESMPLDRAALLACGVITGVGAVINTARVEPGSSVVVIGAGGVGLNAIQGAAMSSAYPIIAVDILENKLKSAQLFGATHTGNATNPELAEMVKDLTSGRGADYVFVTVGNSAAVSHGLSLIRIRQGTLVIVGIPESSVEVPVPVLPLVVKEHKIIGSFMGSTRLRVDIPRLIHQYENGRLKLDELISGRFALEQINEAIESTEKGDALRNVIIFSND